MPAPASLSTRVAYDVQVDGQGFDDGEGGVGHPVDDIPKVLWWWKGHKCRISIGLDLLGTVFANTVCRSFPVRGPTMWLGRGLDRYVKYVACERVLFRRVSSGRGGGSVRSIEGTGRMMNLRKGSGGIWL